MTSPQQTTDQILKERGSRYGVFADHARYTQLLKGVLASGPGYKICTHSQKEALDMIAHKLGRIINGDPNYADSWVDIAGYAQLIVKELEGEKV